MTNYFFNQSLFEYYVFGLVASAAVSDYFYGKIYNWMTLPSLFLGLFSHFAFLGFDGLIFSIKGFLLMSIFMLPVYFLGVVGAGDVKIFMAIGSLLGAARAIVLLSWTSVFLGFIAFILLFLRRRAFLFFSETYKSVRSLVTPGLVFQFPKLSDKSKSPVAPIILIVLILNFFGILK